MRDPWIIHSLLDSDFYKFTMGQVVYLRFRDVPVKYALENRSTSVALADFIDEAELRAQLDHLRALRVSPAEIEYLRQQTDSAGQRIFVEAYLDFLERVQLCDYRLERFNGDYRLEFMGPWSAGIYWETPALAILSEMFARSFLARQTADEAAVWAEGDARLRRKIEILKKHPEITFSDFGARRRFSRAWHDHVVETLSRELPKQFKGTSDVFLAQKHGVYPIGTFGHEMFMGMSGAMHASDDEILRSHNEVLKLWWQQYGAGGAVALTDNYGSEFFFRDMTAEQARQWKGLRQDSGDPMEFGERAIQFYRRHGIDPREKLIVFSDGLDLPTILDLSKRFQGRIQTTFGWGTDLTNDLGWKPPQIVIKLVESCGHGTVKLSDNLAKVTGSPEDVKRFMRIFEYPDGDE